MLGPLELDTPEEMADLLGERFRHTRLQLGLKQETLAERSGVSVATIRRFERSGQITLHKLLELAFALGRLGDFAELMLPPKARTMAELEWMENQRERAPQRGRR